MAHIAQFGKLLSEGIVSVAKRRDKDVSAIESELAEELGYSHHTVQRWRRGYLPKEPEQIAFTVRYCVRQGRVGRSWAKSLLIQSHYPDRESFLEELFPEQPQHPAMSHVYQNLPPRYGNFVGRETDVARVLEGLASRWPLVSIEGIGGVGKTTLAIESACRCISQHNTSSDMYFDAVVWVSAKDRPEQKYWLNETLDAIAHVLDYPYIAQLQTEKKPAEVDQLLRKQRTLIILDNFETLKDARLIAWMQVVPEPSKVLFTSRRAQLRSAWAVQLQGLPEQEAIEFIRRHARRLGLGRIEASDDGALLPLVRRQA